VECPRVILTFFKHFALQVWNLSNYSLDYNPREMQQHTFPLNAELLPMYNVFMHR